jgi:hypothetical protein
MRAAYFSTFGGLGNLDWIGTLGGVLLAVAVTSVTPYVIERMTDHGFRQWTRAIIYAISVVYLARAGWLMLR